MSTKRTRRKSSQKPPQQEELKNNIQVAKVIDNANVVFITTGAGMGDLPGTFLYYNTLLLFYINCVMTVIGARKEMIYNQSSVTSLLNVLKIWKQTIELL